MTASVLAAQEIQSISEQEFLEGVQRWEPRFEELKARVEGAQAEIASAKLLPNPALSYSREEVFSSRQNLPENYLLMELPVDISGRRAARVHAAQAGAEATAADTERERLTLTLDALDLYHDAALARLRAETLRNGRGAIARLVEVAKVRAAAGDVSGYDHGRLEVELTAYDDLFAEAETKLAAGRRALGRMFGDAEAMYEAVDPLAVPELPALSPDLITGAVESRADHRAARERLRQADFELSAARRAWIPRPAFSGGWKSSDTGSEAANGYVAGIGFTLPLFDHGQGERAAARARRHEAEARLRLLSWQIASAIETAQLELKGRVERARRFEEAQLPRLDRLVSRAETSYREGEHTLFELLDAYRTSRETRLRSLELRREAKRAQVQLWRALGQRLEGGAP